MELKEKIKGLRLSKKFSQQELAEKLFVSQQAVGKWESGQSTPDLQQLIGLKELFGISLDELITNEVKKEIEAIEFYEKYYGTLFELDIVRFDYQNDAFRIYFTFKNTTSKMFSVKESTFIMFDEKGDEIKSRLSNSGVSMSGPFVGGKSLDSIPDLVPPYANVNINLVYKSQFNTAKLYMNWENGDVTIFKFDKNVMKTCSDYLKVSDQQILNDSKYSFNSFEFNALVAFYIKNNRFDKLILLYHTTKTEFPSNLYDSVLTSETISKSDVDILSSLIPFNVLNEYVLTKKVFNDKLIEKCMMNASSNENSDDLERKLKYQIGNGRLDEQIIEFLDDEVFVRIYLPEIDDIDMRIKSYFYNVLFNSKITFMSIYNYGKTLVTRYNDGNSQLANFLVRKMKENQSLYNKFIEIDKSDKIIICRGYFENLSKPNSHNRNIVFSAIAMEYLNDEIHREFGSLFKKVKNIDYSSNDFSTKYILENLNLDAHTVFKLIRNYPDRFNEEERLDLILKWNITNFEYLKIDYIQNYLSMESIPLVYENIKNSEISYIMLSKKFIFDIEFAAARNKMINVLMHDLSLSDQDIEIVVQILVNNTDILSKPEIAEFANILLVENRKYFQKQNNNKMIHQHEIAKFNLSPLKEFMSEISYNELLMNEITWQREQTETIERAIADYDDDY